jgi:hypothetical protein
VQATLVIYTPNTVLTIVAAARSLTSQPNIRELLRNLSLSLYVTFSVIVASKKKSKLEVGIIGDMS